MQLLNKCCQSATELQAYLMLNITFMDLLKDDSGGMEQEENTSFL